MVGLSDDIVTGRNQAGTLIGLKRVNVGSGDLTAFTRGRALLAVDQCSIWPLDCGSGPSTTNPRATFMLDSPRFISQAKPTTPDVSDVTRPLRPNRVTSCSLGREVDAHRPYEVPKLRLGDGSGCTRGDSTTTQDLRFPLCGQLGSECAAKALPSTIRQRADSKNVIVAKLVARGHSHRLTESHTSRF